MGVRVRAASAAMRLLFICASGGEHGRRRARGHTAGVRLIQRRTHLLFLVVGAVAALSPNFPAAAVTQEEIDRVIVHVCEQQKYIYAPEKHLIQERCDHRFVASGVRYWISYTHTLDLREPSCPARRPWCAMPERLILFVVTWPATDTSSREEVIVEEAWGTSPTFGVVWIGGTEQEQLFVARKAPHGPNDEGHPGKGPEHRAYWHKRFEEIIRLVLRRFSSEGAEGEAGALLSATGTGIP